MTLEKRVAVHESRVIGKASDRIRRFIWTDNTYDDYRTVLLVDGWDFGRFRKNPQFHWAHMSFMPPIGNIVDHGTEEYEREIPAIGERDARKITDKRRWCDVRFAKEKSYEFAETTLRLVDEGMLRATSAGFNPLEQRDPTDEEKELFGIPEAHFEENSFPKPKVFARNKLFEVSLVSLPGNENAVKEFQKIAQRIMPGGDWVETSDGLSVPEYCHDLLTRIAHRMAGIDYDPKKVEAAYAKALVRNEPSTIEVVATTMTPEEIAAIAKDIDAQKVISREIAKGLHIRIEGMDKRDADEQIMKLKAISKAALDVAQYIEENVKEPASDADTDEPGEPPADDVGEGQEKTAGLGIQQIIDILTPDEDKAQNWQLSPHFIKRINKAVEEAVKRVQVGIPEEKLDELIRLMRTRPGAQAQTGDSYLDGLVEENLAHEDSMKSILGNLGDPGSS